MDAGTSTHLNLQSVSRVPDFYLPQDHQGDNNFYRPDLLLTIPQPHNDPDLYPTGSTQHIKTSHTILILEVGFTGDTHMLTTEQTKSQQHQQLADLLLEAGWNRTTQHIPIIPLVFGHSGSILLTTRRALMTHLRLPYHTAEKLCKKISTAAHTRLAHIQCQRHKLVANLHPK